MWTWDSSWRNERRGFDSATLGECERHSATPSREAQFPRISAFRNPHFWNERKVIDHHNQ